MSSRRKGEVMNSKAMISAAAVVAALATSVTAATVTVDATAPTTSTLNSGSTIDCNGAGCGVTNVGLSSGAYRSPFGDSNNTDFYYYVQAGSEGIFSFTTAQSSVSFLWGSPDTYNTLSFYDANNNLIDSVTPDASGVWDPVGLSSKYVTIVPTAVFYSIGFSSSQNSFEFANVTTTPVPLPAAGLLLVGALGGLGVMSRKRRA